MDAVSIYIVPLGALIAAVMFFWVCPKGYAREQVQTGRDKTLGGWFEPVTPVSFRGNYIYRLCAWHFLWRDWLGNRVAKGAKDMLEVNHLTFKVNENGIERSIVKDISFQAKDGEMLVITGPNGGGKSTLARVLMGIVEADAGENLLDGEDITGYDIDHRAKAGLGFAFQQPPRFKGMTVSKLLSLAAGRTLSEPECCKLLSMWDCVLRNILPGRSTGPSPAVR